MYTMICIYDGGKQFFNMAALLLRRGRGVKGAE